MKEQIAGFRAASLAKDKGFKHYNSNIYYDVLDECLVNGLAEDYKDHNSMYGYLSAPPQSLLQKWLRDKGIIIEIQLDQTSYPKYCFDIYKYKHFGNYEKINNPDWGLYSSYEKALESALLIGLCNIE